MSDSWNTVLTIAVLLSLIKTTVLFFIILYLFYFTLHLLFLLSIPPLLLISIINSTYHQLPNPISHLLTKLFISIFLIFSIHCFIPILYYFCMLCDTFQIGLYLYLKSLFLYNCLNFIFPTSF